MERQDSQRAGSYIERLRKEYPDVITEDSEYFIYPLVDRDGRQIVAHTPKWEKIPVKIGDAATRYVPVADVIEAELKYRKEFGRDDYVLSEALRLAGKL